MPELPEVENIVVSVASFLEGQQLESIEIIHPSIVSGDPDLVRKTIEGQGVKV